MAITTRTVKPARVVVERTFSESAMRDKWHQARALNIQYRGRIQTLTAQVERLIDEAAGKRPAELDKAYAVCKRQRQENKNLQERLRKFKGGRDPESKRRAKEIKSLKIKDRCKCQTKENAGH